MSYLTLKQLCDKFLVDSHNFEQSYSGNNDNFDVPPIEINKFNNILLKQEKVLVKEQLSILALGDTSSNLYIIKGVNCLRIKITIKQNYYNKLDEI